MSYDVNVEKENKTVFDANITYNMAPVFAIVFNDKHGIKVIDGMSATNALPLIIPAYKSLYNNSKTLMLKSRDKSLTSYEIALKAFEGVIIELIKHPKSIIRIY